MSRYSDVKISPELRTRFDKDLKAVIPQRNPLQKSPRDKAIVFGLTTTAVVVIFGAFYVQEEILPRAPLPVVNRPTPPAPPIAASIIEGVMDPDLAALLPKLDLPVADLTPYEADPEAAAEAAETELVDAASKTGKVPLPDGEDKAEARPASPAEPG